MHRYWIFGILIFLLWLFTESSLGKRNRCENMVSQDYSSYDDLTSLESVSPAQEFYSRFSNMVIFAPTKDEHVSVTPVDSASNDPQKSDSIETVEGRTKSKDAWGWFVQEEDQLFLN